MAVQADASAQPVTRRKGGAISRRALLGAAAAGGAAVAAARLLGINPESVLSRSGVGTSVATGKDWTSPLGSESARTLQLLRRAAFGGDAAEIEKSLSEGFDKTLDRLLDTPPVKPPDLLGADQASAAAPLRLPKLQGWWLSHMVTTPTPLVERVTLFWHGHFTSDYRKVGLRYPYLYWQNQTWRDNALGDFRKFLYQVTVDPAMLRYLDLGTSTGAAPNENYSRELMELFTMGAGAFTEDDVRAAAKALAGWREPVTQAFADAAKMLPVGMGRVAAALPVDSVKTGVFVPRRAYRGSPLTFLGRTGQLDTQGVLDRIIAQPATAPYVTGRLAQHFLMPNPPAATVKRLAGGFVKSGWSVKELLRSIFTSPEFASQAAYRSLVKNPVETAVHALRALGASSQPALAAALEAQGRMGMTLFDPPDVGGWPLNASWISSNTVLARVNFVTGLMKAVPAPPSAKSAHLDHLDGVLSSATHALLGAATTDLERWTTVLASPEFQLK